MKYFIAGGAGFIGSHLVKTILSETSNIEVTIYDNFSSGRLWHIDEVRQNKKLKVVEGDIKDLDKLVESMKEADVVYHFASNPDISKAETQPDIDFWEGTYLTTNILEAMRINNVSNLLYASGSGVYGDTGSLMTHEDYSPMLPISTYGASKLGCEALICSYCFMFDLNAAAFRFANVVGPHQTHGIGYDFVKKLIKYPKELLILGDGTQSKSYIYVTDVISAMRLIEKSALSKYNCYNVATVDYITVAEIANIVVDTLNLNNVNLKYAGGKRGWKGDVPIVRLSSEKIREYGWKNQYSSKEAIYKSVLSIYNDANSNKFGWNGET
ncbi:MAG: NAD-dependent epimerase/dehydratase family protein [Bacteroidetes bacterium]|nr:NAD-dependent epimerase/dehydratase family protein [Bacteroidota bacterium]